MSDTAVAAARLGFRVLPVAGGQKRPPLWRSWERRATAEISVVRATWKKLPGANVGIACGDGLVVLDVDRGDPPRGLRPDDLPRTPVVRSGRGTHAYFRGHGRTRANVVPGVDIRGRGSYVLTAGSIHPSGDRYQWLIHPDEAPLAPLPDELTALIARQPAIRRRSEADVLTVGERNTGLTRLAGALRRAGVSADGTAAALHAENRARCRPPLSTEEVARIAKSASSWPSPPEWLVDPVAFSVDPALRPMERLLLYILSRHSRDDGTCFPGVRRLAHLLGATPDTATAAVRRLEQAGRIAVDRSRRSNVYTILPHSNSEASVSPNNRGSSVPAARTEDGRRA